MNGAVGAHSKAGPQNAGSLIAAHGEHNDLATMFLLQPECLFQSVVIGFTGNEREVLVFYPGFCFIDDKTRCGIGYRLDTADDFHI